MACALALLAAACGPGRRTASETVDRFLQAVQRSDLDALFCLMAGAATSPELGPDAEQRREAFAAWAGARYEAYLDGRDRGRVDLGTDGIVLVKLFALGQGTFLSREASRTGANGELVLDTEVRFGYAYLDLSGLSPGTTFYVCGVPVGRVHAVRVPRGAGEVRLEALDRVRVEWRVVRAEASESCPSGWAVDAVVPLADTASSTEIVWVF